MEFDKSKVYTALNADELKVGSLCYLADTLSVLQFMCEEETAGETLEEVKPKDCERRFKGGTFSYALAYLLWEPEEKKLKWNDLKIGDVIKSRLVLGVEKMVTGTDRNPDAKTHIFAGDWMDDKTLELWEKVEK